jgi:hypothetical protein
LRPVPSESQTEAPEVIDERHAIREWRAGEYDELG